MDGSGEAPRSASLQTYTNVLAMASTVFSPDTTVWCEAYKGALFSLAAAGGRNYPPKEDQQYVCVCAPMFTASTAHGAKSQMWTRAQGQVSEQNALRTRAHCYCADQGTSHTRRVGLPS